MRCEIYRWKTDSFWAKRRSIRLFVWRKLWAGLERKIKAINHRWKTIKTAQRRWVQLEVRRSKALKNVKDMELQVGLWQHTPVQARLLQRDTHSRVYRPPVTETNLFEGNNSCRARSVLWIWQLIRVCFCGVTLSCLYDHSGAGLPLPAGLSLVHYWAAKQTRL